jgi:outer membrane receptor protein involved in Fe transport
VSAWKIPYVPDVQLDAVFSLEVLPRLTLLPTFRIVDRRVSDLYATERLKAFVVVGLKTQYSLLRSLDLFVDFQNLTNSTYDSWKGYRATPFVASAGMSVLW